MCDQKFAKAAGLKIHMNIHTFHTTYNCKMCPKRFPNQTKLDQHTKLHTDKRTHQCEVCERFFGDPAKRKKHMLQHTDKCESQDRSYRPQSTVSITTNKETYECDVCQATFINLRLFAKHTEEHKVAEQYECQICSAQFSDVDGLSEHDKACHKKPFECDICRRTFARLHSIRRHMDVHKNGGGKPLKCKRCKSIFYTKRDFDRHRQIHHDKKTFNCPECRKSYDTYSDLYEHLIVHTMSVTVATVTCKICQKSMSQLDLPAHMDVHREKTYPCGRCDEICSSLYDLKSHIDAYHRKPTTYVCKLCGREFAASDHLKRHTMVHDGGKRKPLKLSKEKRIQTERRKMESEINIVTKRSTNNLNDDEQCSKPTPYNCEKCNAKCTTLLALKTHIEKHRKEKSFKCRQCGKRYSSKEHLKEHTKRRHDDGKHQKSYPCGICGKMLTAALELSQHLQIHDGKTYRCELCKHIFSSPDDLRAHSARDRCSKKVQIQKC